MATTVYCYVVVISKTINSLKLKLFKYNYEFIWCTKITFSILEWPFSFVYIVLWQKQQACLCSNICCLFKASESAWMTIIYRNIKIMVSKLYWLEQIITTELDFVGLMSFLCSFLSFIVTRNSALYMKRGVPKTKVKILGILSHKWRVFFFY